MVHRPTGIGAFEFAVLASLRAAQLCRGCLPRVEGDHCRSVTAQMEVAAGAVIAAPLAAKDATTELTAIAVLEPAAGVPVAL